MISLLETCIKNYTTLVVGPVPVWIVWNVSHQDQAIYYTYALQIFAYIMLCSKKFRTGVVAAEKLRQEIDNSWHGQYNISQRAPKCCLY